MAEQKMGLTEEEKKQIAETVKGMKSRRKSVLDPPEETVTRRISVLDETPAAPSSEPEDLGEDPAGTKPALAPAPTKKSKAKKAESPAQAPAPPPAAEEEDDSLFNDGDFNEEQEEETAPEPAPAPAPQAPKAVKKKEKPEPPTEVVPPESWQERGKMITRVRVQYELEEEECSVLSASTTDGTKVKVALGFTINLGDMAFARVDVGLELPTMKEDIPEAYSTAWKISEREIKHQVELIEKSPMNKKKGTNGNG